MNYIQIDTLGLRLSKLAFGCAPVMGRIGRAQALRAMHTAFDAGITHFDIARSYGYGEAESVLGQFATGKRERITIATKLGIAPPRQQRALRWLKPVVREITRHAPALRKLRRVASSRALTRGAFDIVSARRSFEDSLRELKLDCVDILFLHDCSPADDLSDELQIWLSDLVCSGKTRAWGIATSREWVDDVFAQLHVKPGITQFQGSFSDLSMPRTAQSLPTLLHSPFGNLHSTGFYEALNRAASTALRFHGKKRRHTADVLPRLLLESTIFRNTGKVVLCSMFDSEHIRENVAAVDSPMFTHEELNAFFKALESVSSCSRDSAIRLGIPQ